MTEKIKRPLDYHWTRGDHYNTPGTDIEFSVVLELKAIDRRIRSITFTEWDSDTASLFGRYKLASSEFEFRAIIDQATAGDAYPETDGFCCAEIEVYQVERILD